MTGARKTVSRADFRREVIPDDDHGASYLDQDGFEDRREAYRQDRREAYQRGEFRFVGVRASVDLKIPFGKGHVTQRVTSPGLWSIESDSAESYFAEVFSEECATLAEIVADLGFTVTD